MTCQKYEPLIALEIEGDLPPRDAVKLAAHLKLCRACHQFAAEMRASQAALHAFSRDQLPEAVFAELRRSVMSEIAQRETTTDFWRRFLRPLRWQYAALAGVLALLFLSAMFYLLKPDPKPVIVNNQSQNERPPDLKQTEAPETTPQKVREQRRHKPASRAKFVKASEPESQNDVAVVTTLAETEMIPEPGLTNSTDKTDDQKIRMEIQTRDPNIRIIWFLNKPASD
jgi:hypothetical protein